MTTHPTPITRPTGTPRGTARALASTAVRVAAAVTALLAALAVIGSTVDPAEARHAGSRVHDAITHVIPG